MARIEAADMAAHGDDARLLRVSPAGDQQHCRRGNLNHHMCLRAYSSMFAPPPQRIAPPPPAPQRARIRLGRADAVGKIVATMFLMPYLAAATSSVPLGLPTISDTIPAGDALQRVPMFLTECTLARHANLIAHRPNLSLCFPKYDRSERGVRRSGK